MQTNKVTKIIIVLLVLFIFSCGTKYEVKTIVNEDGSCLRTLIVTCGDSIDTFYDENYPIPIDSTWNLIIEQDTNENGDTVFVHSATKYFESISLLNKMYVQDTSNYKIINRRVEFKKRFRWFYTFFDYQETYPKLFDQPSLDTYLDSTHYFYAMLTDDEQEDYLAEKFDSIAAKQFEEENEIGFGKWLEYAIVNSCLQAVEKSSKNIKNWSLSESEFSRRKDSILGLIDGSLELFDSEDDLWEILEKEFELDSALFQKLELEDEYRNFITKYDFWEDKFLDEDYTNLVAMPGLIIETTSKSISEDNEVLWNVDLMKYFTDDYEMKVSSRIVNVWAFWVSGIVIVLLILIIFIKKLVKN